MRSVYTKVLLWSFGTLVFSLIAFFAIGFYGHRRELRAGSPFVRDTYLLDEAVEAYKTGGPERLRSLLQKQESYFRLNAHLTNASGIDVLSGEDFSRNFPAEGGGVRPRRTDGKLVLVIPDRSNQFRFVVSIPDPPFDVKALIPYYAMLMLAIAGLSWLLAVNIAAPLRKLSRTVERFGTGDLDARFEVRRHDEIGELARAFNQMAERLQTLLTAERRLLQDISHELRSPLARLSFAAELTRTATDRNAAVARLRKEIDRLADLVSGLIQVTRAEGEFPERNLEDVSLGELVQEVCSGCELEAMAKQCHVDATAPGDIVLRGDAELLRRAVENVVRNAIRYSPENSRVEVQVEKNGSTTQICVRDHGTGVPEEMLGRIFTPFFRVDSSRDTATGGVGLGLAIAQRAILLHHGDISAGNANPGLRVTITLPLASASA